jgi:RecA-family ATPase
MSAHGLHVEPLPNPNGRVGSGSGAADLDDDRPLTGPELAAFPGAVPDFLWAGFILENAVNLIAGDGGTGKTILLLHQAVAVSQGIELFGRPTKRMPVLLVLAEDDKAITRARLIAIANSMGVQADDLGKLHVWCRPGRDSVLAIINDDGTWRPGPFLGSLRKELARIGPCMLALDTVADIAALDETKRLPVNSLCKTILGGLCREIGITIVLNAHPSKAAMKDGSGYAGSTAWNNAVRSRLIFEGLPELEDSPVRTLKVAKSNYAAKAALDLVLQGCILKVPSGRDVPEQHAAEREAVLAVLDDLRRKDIRVLKSNGDGHKPSDLVKVMKEMRGLKVTVVRVKDTLNQLERDGLIRYQESVPGKKGRRATYEVCASA